jgi:hypothetical protein
MDSDSISALRKRLCLVRRNRYTRPNEIYERYTRIDAMSTLTRRSFLGLLPASCALATWTRAAEEPHWQLSFEDEVHEGDPGVSPDVVTFKYAFKGVGPSYRQIAQAAYDDPVDRSLLPAPKPSEFALRLLAVAEEYIGVSRENEHKEKVRQFLRLFGFDLMLESGEKVAFCAAGLCFAACRAYLELSQRSYDKNRPSLLFRRVFPSLRENFFIANPQVLNIWSYGKRFRGNVVAPSVQPKPGWPVIFSWHRDGKPNHIGIVKDPNPDGKLVTVEFNTSRDDSGDQSNSGYVAERHRERGSVLNYIRLY